MSMSRFCLRMGLVLCLGAICSSGHAVPGYEQQERLNCPCYYDGTWHDCNKSPFSGDNRCVCGTSGSDWKSPDQCKQPTPQDVPGYDKHERLDCYEGHGGLCNGGACDDGQGHDIGYKPDVTSADDCGKTCDDDSSCSCFVFMGSQNKCYIRSQCTVADCEVRNPGDQDQFDSYTKMQMPTPAPTPMPLPPNPPKNIMPYQAEQGALCGQDIATSAMTVEDAKAYCSQNPDCKGFYYPDPSAHVKSDTYTKVQTPQFVPGYEQHERLDCYEGHGGLCKGGACSDGQGHDIGYKPDATSAEACGMACDDDSSCSCFVFMVSQNKCYLRSQCTVADCEVRNPGDQDQFDTYIKPAGCPCIDDGNWHTCNGVLVNRGPGTCNNQPSPDQKVEVHFQSSWTPCSSSTSIRGSSAQLDAYTRNRPFYGIVTGSVMGNPMHTDDSVKVGDAMEKCITMKCQGFSYTVGHPVTRDDVNPAGYVQVKYFVENSFRDGDANFFTYVPHSQKSSMLTSSPGQSTLAV